MSNAYQSQQLCQEKKWVYIFIAIFRLCGLETDKKHNSPSLQFTVGQDTMNVCTGASQ